MELIVILIMLIGAALRKILMDDAAYIGAKNHAKDKGLDYYEIDGRKYDLETKEPFWDTWIDHEDGTRHRVRMSTKRHWIIKDYHQEELDKLRKEEYDAAVAEGRRLYAWDNRIGMGGNAALRPGGIRYKDRFTGEMYRVVKLSMAYSGHDGDENLYTGLQNLRTGFVYDVLDNQKLDRYTTDVDLKQVITRHNNYVVNEYIKRGTTNVVLKDFVHKNDCRNSSDPWEQRGHEEEAKYDAVYWKPRKLKLIDETKSVEEHYILLKFRMDDETEMFFTDVMYDRSAAIHKNYTIEMIKKYVEGKIKQKPDPYFD